MLRPADFFDLAPFSHNEIFSGLDYVWQVIDRIAPWLAERVPKGREILGQVHEGAYLEGQGIYIGPGTVVEPGAFIQGPVWIGENCKISHGAYVRGNVITGKDCIIGHVTEVKNSLFLNHACAPHFAYVGDSVLGNHANLGAGTKLSNLTVSSIKDKNTGRRPTLKLRIQGKTYDTGLAKFGAILGDGAQTGCNTVCNPGTLIGRQTLVYANASVRGYIPSGHVVKLRQTQQQKGRRI